MAKAVFLGFRRSKNASKKREALIRVEGVRSAEKAAQLVGHRVLWRKEGFRHHRGKVLGPHGRKGILRVRFRRHPPAWSGGSEIEIL